ncbi:MAG TPA: hypothetical protein VMY37_23240 [Thermoguttaceae bacterium]|nr:hypothetical protein [Thermoguttaceae bacterium]
MSHRKRPKTGESFEEKLTRLRWKIDSLPEKQRPHLYALADAIERQRQRLQQLEPPIHDAD